MQTFTSAELIDGGAAVALTRADGTQSRFHAVWLRDNALDTETRAEANGQRLITLADIPQTTRLASASFNGADELSLVFQPEGKTVSFRHQRSWDSLRHLRAMRWALARSDEQ